MAQWHVGSAITILLEPKACLYTTACNDMPRHGSAAVLTEQGNEDGVLGCSIDGRPEFHWTPHGDGFGGNVAGVPCPLWPSVATWDQPLH